MTRLEIRLLGGYGIRLDGELVEGVGREKERALLAYLAVESDRTHRRERLAGLLWPDDPERNARRNLRVVLYRIRNIIGDRDAAPPFLLIGTDALRLNPDADLTVDVQAFAALVEAVAAHDHEQLERCTTCADSLAQAAALYSGDLLSGFSVDSAVFEEWIVVQRERLHRQALDVFDQLATYQLVQGAYPEALSTARLQIALEPWQERAHRQAMVALARSGQRAAAAAQYESCVRVLAEELGIEPETATTALYREIVAGGVASASTDALLAGQETPAGGDTTTSDDRHTGVASPSTLAIRAETLPSLDAEPAVSRTGADTAGGYAIEETGVAGRRFVGTERRVISLLVANVGDTAQIPRDLGLEIWAELLGEVLDALQAAVATYGGTVMQRRETGLVAAFGAEAAYEDIPQRAVLAALAMTEAALPVANEAEGMGRDLTLTVGVTTGPAVVRSTDTGGVTVHTQALAQLEALQAQVPEGAVWVTEAMYRRVEFDFDWAWLGEGRVGQEAPVHLYRPVAPVVTPAEHEVGGYHVPLVGREAELQALLDAVERVRAGIGGIVTVVGNAGVGKSRLVAETREREYGAGRDEQDARGERVRWVEGRWLSYTQGVAYRGWQELLRRLLGLTEDCDRRVCTMLEDRVASLCSDGAESITPYLARLLSLPLQEATAAKLDSLVEGGLLQGAIFQAVSMLLTCAAGQGPLILVLEDVHWADDASLALLAHLLPLTDRVPLLLIALLRPLREHGAWRMRELLDRDYAHRHSDVPLQPLSADDSRRLVSQLLGAGVDKSPEQVVSVLNRAEGNPFFAAEIVRSLLDRAMAADALPVTVQEVLMARIDRLPTAARRVLQLAAVVGRIFSYDVLAALAVDEGPAAESGLLDDALLALIRAQMIREYRPVGDATRPRTLAEAGERAYIFDHELTLEAAYSSLLHRKRRVLHRRVAEALERLYPEQVPAQLGMLAYHWERAGVAPRAVDYLERASAQAAAQYANAEAVDYIARALRLVPESDLEQQYALRLAREQLHHLRGERDAEAQDLDALQTLAEALDSPRRLAEVAVRRARRYGIVGRPDLAHEEAERAVVIAREIGDAMVEAEGLLYLGQALRTHDRLPTGLAQLEQALERARAVGGHLLEGRILREHGIRLIWVAELAEAKAVLEDALATSRRSGDLVGEAKVIDALALRSLYAADYVGALELTTEGTARHRQVGNRYDEGYSLGTRSWALSLLGQFGEAKAAAEMSLALLQKVGARHGVGYALTHRARVLMELGTYPAARALFGEVEQTTPGVGDLFPLQRAWAGLAMVSYLAGDGPAAIAYGEKLMVHMDVDEERWGWYPYLRVWALVVRGRVRLGEGDLNAAERAFTQASNLVTDPEVTIIVRPNLALDVRAGLAAVARVRGDASAATAQVTPMLDALLAGDVAGAMEPMRVFLVAHRVLASQGDLRADEVLAAGHRVLMERAATLDDEVLRQSYLEKVAANRELVAAYRAMGTTNLANLHESVKGQA
ncbi:MAG: AAA family ATPase [Anaerolineae bacterium]|nr:AAA family ATPase [Anaerolineae bacterium]